MTPTDWEEWEALYRADPEAFVARMNAGRLSAEARSIWASRLAADGIELPVEATASLPFAQTNDKSFDVRIRVGGRNLMFEVQINHKY